MSLARSEATQHQAFRAEGSVLGLLFHLEAPAAQVARMSEAFAAELEACSIDPASLTKLGEIASVDLDPVAMTVLGSWARALAVAD